MDSIARTSALLDSTRDLTVDAAASARIVNSRSSNRDPPLAQVKKSLDSRNDREILEGLRKVISMMYRSKSCLPFFSAVVKNVASPNIEIKKLVYIYLLHHAEAEPDLALLSINTIQKSLSDQNPQVRAMALRVMSGIRVPVISQIVSLAIKKGVADMSPYVRKAAALAIPKCYRLDPNTLPQLLEYISTLLGDRQYYAAGPAVIAFLEVCPDRIDLIHKHYRALLRKVVDMDEWSQLATLRLLTFYSRKCFPRKTKRRKKGKDRGFFDHGASDAEDDESGDEVTVLGPDQEALLKACQSLLSSRNSAVVVGAVRCLLDMGTDLNVAVGPLIALLRSAEEVQLVALYNIVAVCLVQPQWLVRYASHFLVKSSDTPETSKLKMELLTLVFPHCEQHVREMILSELEHFAHSNGLDLVRESVRAIGRCAQNDSSTSDRCLGLLLQQTSSQDGQLVAESLTVIRHLIQRDPQQHTNTVIILAKNLDTITNPQARATIIWLVGEFAGLPAHQNFAPDVLRILASGFADESETAKLQIVLLAAKVYLHHLLWAASTKEDERQEIPTQGTALNEDSSETQINGNEWAGPPTTSSPTKPEDHPIPMLWEYILQLTRYDTSYDLRDRARLYKALLADPTSTQLASLVLLAPKPTPHVPSPSENRKGLLLGSSSLVVGTRNINGYEDLPDRVQEGDEPDPKLRDEPSMPLTSVRAGFATTPTAAPAAAELDRAVKEKGLAKAPTKDKSLDDWLNEESESEEEGTTDEEESETEEGTDEEEYEEVTDSEAEEEQAEREPLVQ